MVRCNPRPPGHTLGAVTIAAMLAAVAVAAIPPVARAQPAPDIDGRGLPPAGSAAESQRGLIDRARDLYLSAEAAMKDGRFDDAVRDYGAAYDLSKDPALFFKIGRANERAGKCEVALSYYARYLNDGKPSEQFASATRQRITACGGDPARVAGSGRQAVTTPTPAGDTATTPTPAPTRPGTAAPVAPAPPAPAARPTGPPDTDTRSAEAAAGDAAATGKPVPGTGHKIAWVLTGSGLALAALGGVLAYASDSSENDVRDLYVGTGGQPPVFDADTRKRYDELIDQGHRYEQMSWAAFGLAGAAAVGAVVLFVLGGDEAAPPVRITPVVAPGSAGIALTF